MNKNPSDCAHTASAEQFMASEMQRSTSELRTAVGRCSRSFLQAINPVRWFKRHPVSASILAGAGLAGGAAVAVYAYRKRQDPAPDAPNIHVHFEKPAGSRHELARRVGTALASIAMTQASLWIKSRSGLADLNAGSETLGSSARESTGTDC
jgi:hypothetical protein